MAARVTFRPNPTFLAEIRRETTPAVEEVARRGEANTIRVGHSIAFTGAYARSIARSGTRVYSTDPGAMAIEFGTRNNPAFAPLRRGADMTGAQLGGR